MVGQSAMKKSTLNSVCYLIGFATFLQCSTREPDDSESLALGTATGQILASHQGKNVCLHKFESNTGRYVISDPKGLECGLNRREAAKQEISYKSDAFGRFLTEIPNGGNIKLDIRYATSKIFPKSDGTFRINKPLYGQARCFLHPKAKAKLEAADRNLRAKKPELRLMMLDCYRPMYVSQIMWDLIRDPRWVAQSGKSGHNKGGTVDLTLAREEQGTWKEIDMGSPFDLFDEKLTPFDVDPSAAKRKSRLLNLGMKAAAIDNRELLLSVMKESGWNSFKDEWWHFSSGKDSENPDHLDLPL
jgi:D-alanyl-D-alanine dipeptidase